jgi:type III pantothenate kinase
MDICLCNIGNTHTSACLCSGNGVMKALFTVDTKEFDASMIPDGIPVAAACVVPAVREKISAERDVFWVSAGNCSGKLDFSKVDSSTLGADRVANAISLAWSYPLPALIVDCGTALTIEIVDENRFFRGGAIAPGRILMRKALFNGTAQLPDIPLSHEVPEKPGTNTVSSMCFGVDRGAVGMVRQLIAQCCAEYGIRHCVAAGGDAEFFLNAIPELEAADEFFTFRGIKLAFGY